MAAGGKGRGDKGSHGGTGGKGGNPCAGKADRTCCAGATGKQWCQGGACEAIPDDATATLAECGGRCDTDLPIPSGHASKEVCGQTLPCMSCNYCQNDPQKCDGSSQVEDGPNGPGVYCFYCTVVDNACDPLGSCPNDKHTECPHPKTQVCSTGNCYNLCTGAGG
jgi:hypothetical protein